LRPVIALLLTGCLMIGGCDRQSTPQGQANESAPAATAPANTVAGNVSSFAGKPVLLNLWATWCVPCVAEMPTLDKLAVSLGDRVQLLTVSQDFKGAEKVDPFFQKAGFQKLQPYLDKKAELSTTLGVNLPTTILYDSQGREVWRMLGGMDWTGETAKELIAEAS
jgi:thiol-disulfide isomerase/thioredoxin